MRRGTTTLIVVMPLVCLMTACGAATHAGSIRVTLTAQNHHPRASHSPAVQWGYCVRVTTAAGHSVASRIHLQIVSGRTPVAQVGLVSLEKGYDHWCASIGGEASVLNAVPRGEKLDFSGCRDGGSVDRQAELADRRPVSFRTVWPIDGRAPNIF